MQHSSDILVVASCSDGRVDPETYDLLAFAGVLCSLRPGGVRAMVSVKTSMRPPGKSPGAEAST